MRRETHSRYNRPGRTMQSVNVGSGRKVTAGSVLKRRPLERNVSMREPAGLAYLRSFPDFELGNVRPGTAFTLDRVLALLEEVGSPHLRHQVIHLAGTKARVRLRPWWRQ